MIAIMKLMPKASLPMSFSHGRTFVFGCCSEQKFMEIRVWEFTWSHAIEFNKNICISNTVF